MPYVPHTDHERREMLAAIGVESIDDLFEAIPKKLRPKTYELFDSVPPSERPVSFDVPPGMSELLMAGYLAGRGVPLVRARTVPLWVPAHSEIVIEGWVDTDCGVIDYVPQRRDGKLVEPVGPGGVIEGPFGDHTGFYSLPDRYPLVEVTAVTHRRSAVFPATIVGRPPQEDYYLGKATERIFLPLLRMMIPDLEDYHLPLFGTFHNCAFIKISKFYPLQARRVMHAVWGAGQMAWEKMIVVVDHDPYALEAAGEFGMKPLKVNYPEAHKKSGQADDPSTFKPLRQYDELAMEIASLKAAKIPVTPPGQRRDDLIRV